MRAVFLALLLQLVVAETKLPTTLLDTQSFYIGIAVFTHDLNCDCSSVSSDDQLDTASIQAQLGKAIAIFETYALNATATLISSDLIPCCSPSRVGVYVDGTYYASPRVELSARPLVDLVQEITHRQSSAFHTAPIKILSVISYFPPILFVAIVVAMAVRSALDKGSSTKENSKLVQLERQAESKLRRREAKEASKETVSSKANAEGRPAIGVQTTVGASDSTGAPSTIELPEPEAPSWGAMLWHVLTTGPLPRNRRYTGAAAKRK